VYYELGIAHALGKEVVLIHDSEEAVIPTNIQGYERLSYGFNDDDAFCEKVKKALQEHIHDRYQDLYGKARRFIEAFNRERSTNVPAKDFTRFRADLMSRESAKKLPPLNDNRKLAAYLIPCIADGAMDVDIAAEMKLWIDNTYPASPRPETSLGNQAVKSSVGPPEMFS
jgi:hypothetical protein